MKNIYACLSVIFVILGLEACSNRDDHKIDGETTTNVTNSFSPIPFDNKIGVKADSQTVVVIPYFKSSTGETPGDPVSGFVMNGRCLISSYHAFVKEGFGDPYKITVLFKTGGGWDSTQAKFDRDFSFGKFSLKTHKWRSINSQLIT